MTDDAPCQFIDILLHKLDLIDLEVEQSISFLNTLVVLFLKPLLVVPDQLTLNAALKRVRQEEAVEPTDGHPFTLLEVFKVARKSHALSLENNSSSIEVFESLLKLWKWKTLENVSKRWRSHGDSAW